MREAINAPPVDMKKTVGFRVKTNALRVFQPRGSVSRGERFNAFSLEMGENRTVSRTSVAGFKLFTARLFCGNPVRYQAIRVANGSGASRLYRPCAFAGVLPARVEVPVYGRHQTNHSLVA